MNTINHGLKLEIRMNHKLEIRGSPCSKYKWSVKAPNRFDKFNYLRYIFIICITRKTIQKNVTLSL